MKRANQTEGYFAFSKKERLGILILLLLNIAIIAIPSLLYRPRAFSLIINKEDAVWLAALEREEEKNTNRINNQYSSLNNPLEYISDKADLSLFEFDPNTLDATGWQRLGLRDKTIRTILNYTSKGGRFKKKEDLQRIYGLRPDEYARLAPYVRIETSSPGETTFNPRWKDSVRSYPASTYAKKTVQHIDINRSDTGAWIALPGIGNKLATRIITFREKLGGFYKLEQVKETYGLPDSTFQKILPYLVASPNAVRKININTATPDELKSHPYIRWQIANTIINYRNQHGRFKRLEELKNVMAITEDVYARVLPYLFIE